MTGLVIRHTSVSNFAVVFCGHATACPYVGRAMNFKRYYDTPVEKRETGYIFCEWVF
jgi:hypothetical protein